MNKFEHLKPGVNSPFTGMVAMFENKPNNQEKTVTEKAFFDDVSADQTETAIGNAGEQSARADAMAMVIEWVGDGDDSADALDAYAQALGDLDASGDVDTADEQAVYEDSLTLMAEALTNLGVSAEQATAAMSGDDSASSQAFIAAGDFLANSSDDEDTIINKFAVRETLMMESTVKVIRNGVLKTIRRPFRRKVLSSAQRAALKKARAKANNAGARAARRKSMRIRRSRGM